MSLSINPLAKLVSSVSEQVSAASDAASGVINSNTFASLKSNLDSTVGRLSGEIGTGLNGMTASANDLVSNASGALNGALAGVSGAMGGVGSTIQSLASNATGALGGIAGQLGGAAGSISNAAASIGASLNKLGLASGGVGGGLASLATSVSSAAGMVNNLLSMARGKNLPSGAELFSQSGSFVKLEAESANDWRVKINANFGLFGSAFSRLSATGGFVFPYLPQISVSSKANYTQIDPVHNLQPFYAYKNSQVDDIQISGEFSVENEMDAEYWIQGTTFLKTATRMFFGTGPNVGNPPIICNLTGYGARVFAGVPVIVKSFTVDFKDDVAYMKYSKGGAPTWVPTMSTISITVAPIYNRTRLRQFDLSQYANGNIVAGQGFI
jgi:phage-related protein